jgi:NAD(P)H-flavin reductase
LGPFSANAWLHLGAGAIALGIGLAPLLSIKAGHLHRRFDRVVVALGAVPERTLFIDDKCEKVHGAHRAGPHAVQFGDAARLRRDLHSHRLIEAAADA